MSSKEFIINIMQNMEKLYQEPDMMDVAKYIIDVSPFDKSILIPQKAETINTRDKLFYALLFCLSLTIITREDDENYSSKTMH